MRVIDQFVGNWKELSNFYMCSINFENMCYRSVEHAYQAAKTLDLSLRNYLTRHISSPTAAKRFGRTVALRADWDMVKIPIMKQLITYKFTRYDMLKEKLLSTGDAELIENNTWDDTFWGMSQGVGYNHLGKILMEVRNLVKDYDITFNEELSNGIQFGSEPRANRDLGDGSNRIGTEPRTPHPNIFGNSATVFLEDEPQSPQTRDGFTVAERLLIGSWAEELRRRTYQ